MSKRRTGTPWMDPPDYGHSLTGLSLNLLVSDMAAALEFHRRVLGAVEVYSDEDIAVMRFGGAEWMLHADHTYDGHPLYQTLSASAGRGVGAELRLHGRDPDEAEHAARELGCTVLSPARDQPAHGLREAHLLDADGYVWVPDRRLPDSAG